jgi:DNA polymerase-3 subunit epsilon
VIVENDTIIDTWTHLIRPPRRDFVFTYLHGIAWEHVKSKPTFGDLWGDIAKKLEGVNFVAAHNASFDRSVLRACCETAAVEPAELSFVCTVKAARSIWGFYPTTLADVCRQLRIPLRHHDAESDAQACARILLAARERGHEYHRVLKTCALKASRR